MPRCEEETPSSVSPTPMPPVIEPVETLYPTPGMQRNLDTTPTSERLVAHDLEYLHSPPQTNTSPSNFLAQCEEVQAGSEPPGWISPLRTGLDEDMLWLLRKKKALSVPPQPLRDHLLRAYVQYVHPFLPLLDLEDLMQAFEMKGEARISLVLFQAIMFAGTAFVDMVHLESEGFRTHKEARRAYYERVRLLFDADIELEPIILIQVLLLLTYWFDKIEDTKSRCYWMRLAWSFANDRGLAHPDVLALLPAQQQIFRRRLWWCCFMRDQLISFSERRGSSLMIDEEDFPPLLTADFDCSADPSVLRRFSLSQNEMPSRMLSELCVAKVKLCILVRRLLCSQYELKVHQRLTSTEPTMLFLPRATDSAATEHTDRARELFEWSTNFFATIRPGTSQQQERVNELETVHIAMLEMLYWTVVGMVHRAQLAVKTSTMSRERSLKILREAAERTTVIAQELEEQDLLRFQPPISVTALFGSAMQHLKDLVSGVPARRSLAQQHLAQSLTSLRRLQEVWFSADNVVNFLATIPTTRSATRNLPPIQRPRSASPHNIDISCPPPPIRVAGGVSARTNACPTMMAEADLTLSRPDMLHKSTTGSPNCIGSQTPGDGNYEDLSFELDAMYNVSLSNDFDFAQFDVINWTNILQI
ncbi:hypothetical protein H2200_002751 [Cladophialophora chaetospira]|uniref:Xylanolytic transcriptional activator regulatory domain-containing protein n=1 Tax=Cladophialophora chaetospira TaxID=386627 RepID=A0AA38XJK6_9EURO|nr:hypothetical protein H2200_002751 [Cladophialophora chaetospira]